MAKMKAEEILIEHKCSFMPNQCSIVFSVLTVNEYEFKFYFDSSAIFSLTVPLLGSCISTALINDDDNEDKEQRSK